MKKYRLYARVNGKEGHFDFCLLADALANKEAAVRGGPMTDNDKKLLTKRIAEFKTALEAAGKKREKTIQEGCRLIAEELKVVENLEEQVAILKKRIYEAL